MGDDAGWLSDDQVSDLRGLREVISGPLVEIALRFSRLLADRWPHRALVIFTRECTGRPRKVAGASDIVDRITVEELEALKSAVEVNGVVSRSVSLAGVQRWAWAVRDASDTLLVLIPRQRGDLPDPSGLAAAFGIVSTSIRQQVTQASPDYLAESRAASSERARTTAELTASHEAALSEILATLRSTRLDDRRARVEAADAALTALMALRSRRAADRALSEESPTTAFKRLRRELGPLLRHQEIVAEFVAPPTDDRPLPGEVAHGARAVTQTVVLTLASQSSTGRVRIAWACHDGALVVDVRDQAGGGLDVTTLRRTLDGRARTLNAEVNIESIRGWGNRVTIHLPLDPPVPQPAQILLADLNRRERQVLALVTAGKRNKAIAQELGVAESTVKFHVAALLKKLDVSTRGEAAVIGIRAGIVPVAMSTEDAG